MNKAANAKRNTILFLSVMLIFAFALIVYAVNNIPTLGTPILNATHSANLTTANLTCYANAADIDGDSISYNGFWYKNGTEQFDVWNKTIGGISQEQSTSVAVDSNDSIIATGSTNSSGLYDMWTVKYDANGNQIWNTTFGGNSQDVPNGVAVDSNNSIVVAGWTNTSSFVAGCADILTVKYNSSGNHTWNKTIGGINCEASYGLAIDSNNNIIVTGYTNSSGSMDIWTIKYNSSGNHTWNKTAGGVGVDVGYKVAVDSNDSIIVNGYTNSSGAGSYDFWVIKYNSSGNHTWNKTIGGSNYDTGYGVVVDSQDNIIVSGKTNSSGAGKLDYWIIKLNSSGNVTWNTTIGMANDDEGRAVAVDSNDSIIVTGITYLNPLGAGSYDYWTIKYSPNGTQLWNKTIGGASADYATGVAIDSNDNIIVGGGTSSFGAGDFDFWTVKYYGFNLSSQTQGQTVLVGMLNSSKTTKGDIWSCKIRAYDGTDYTSYSSSNNLTVFSLNCSSCSECDAVVDIPNSIVTLTNDISSSATCITFGAVNVTLDCAGYTIMGDGSGAYAFNTAQKNTTIEGCMIRNWTAAFYLDGLGSILRHSNITNASTARFGGVTIFNNTFSDMGATSSRVLMTLGGNSGFNISSNKFMNIRGNAITFLASARNGWVHDNLIYNYSPNQAISFQAGNSDISMIGNNFSSAPGSQFSLYSQNSLTKSTIKDNVFENGFKYAYFINSSNNTIVNNTFRNAYTVSGSYSGSIVLSAVSDFNTIANNTFYNSTTGNWGHISSIDSGNNYIADNLISGDLEGSQTGIYILNGQNNTVTGNSVSNMSYVGIWMSTNSSYNRIENNTVLAFGTASGGIYIAGNYNNITGNAILNGTASYLLNIRANNTFASENKIINSTSHGIGLIGAVNSTIKNNTIESVGGTGIHIATKSYENYILNNSILYSAKTGDNDAILIEFLSQRNNITGNFIHNVTTSPGTGYGSAITVIANSTSNYIYYNTINSTNYAGVRLTNSSFNRVVGNKMTDPGAYGILTFTDSYNNTISDNIINGSAKGMARGIYNVLDRGMNTIEGNYIRNVTYGFYIDRSNSSIYRNNFIINATSYGTFLEKNASYNIFDNNTMQDVGTAFYLSKTSDFNNFTNNTIKLPSTTAINLNDNAANNTFFGNIINTTVTALTIGNAATLADNYFEENYFYNKTLKFSIGAGTGKNYFNKSKGNYWQDWPSNTGYIHNYTLDAANSFDLAPLGRFNTPPIQGTPLLNATLSTNYTNENLTVYNISTGDADNDNVKSIINWKRNGTSIAVLNMPFEGGSNDTLAKDYSGFGNNATVYGAVWNSTAGYDGRGTYQFDGVNDYISAIDSDPLDLQTQFTIEGRFKPGSRFNASSDYYQGILDKGSYQIYLDKSDGKLKFYMESNQTKAWANVTNGTTSQVWGMAVYDGELYVGGAFTNAGGVGGTNYIARWNGTGWRNVTNGTQATVNGLAVYNGELYVGGGFTDAGGVGGTSRIARWNGTGWRNVTNGTQNTVYGMAAYDGELYVGGAFTDAGGVGGTSRIARWNGTGLRNVTNGTTGNVYGMAVYNGELYVGGTFTSAGGVAASRIARWNGTGWRNVTNGTTAQIYGMAVYDGELYVGGAFTDAGGVGGTRYIARWNGTDWRNVTNGTQIPVYGMAVYNGELYVGGSFTDAGGVGGTRYIARWNGTGWRNVTNGTQATVNGLAVYDGELYVGGTFTSAGGVGGTSNIARWSSGNDTEIGSTTNNWQSNWQHYALTYNNNNLSLYVNGIYENNALKTITLNKNSFPLLLGKTYGSKGSGSFLGADGDYQFNGSLDEIRIYNISLSAEQIKALFNNRTDLIASQETKKHEIWQSCITPNDGLDDGNESCSNNITIANSPPNATNIFTNSTSSLNYTNDNVTVYFTYADADNDAMLYNETMWFNSTGGSITEAREFRNYTTLFAANTTKNQTWIASVRVFDTQYNRSEWWNSTNITIANAPPNATNIFTNATSSLNHTNDNVTVYFTYSDADSDAMLYNETMWFNSTGGSITEAREFRNYTTLYSQNTTKNQTWIASVRVFDTQYNRSNWWNSTNITIANTPPENVTAILTDLVTPTPTSQQQMNVSWQTVAADNDSDIIQYIVYINGTQDFNTTSAYGVIGQTFVMLDGKAYEWWVQAYDGQDYGHNSSRDQFNPNLAPNATNATIYPIIAYANNSLSFRFNYSDAEGHANFNSTYQWTFNGSQLFKYEDRTQADFNRGNLSQNTTTNATGVRIAGTNLSGNYTSAIIYKGDEVVWKKLYWKAQNDTSTNISIYTRTSADGAAWQDWSNMTFSGDSIVNATNPYLQYQARLFGNGTNSPNLILVNATYIVNSTMDAIFVAQFEDSTETIDGEKTLAESNAAYASGKYGKGLGNFKASSIAIRHNSTSNINITGFTIEAWIKPNFTAELSGNYIINIYNGSSQNQIELLISKDGLLTASVWNATPNRQFNTTILFSPASETWYHIAALFNGSNLSLYLNGAYRNSTIMNGSAADVMGNSSIFIGSSGSGGNYFNGSIDEIVIYDYARTSQQINKSYRRGYPIYGLNSSSFVKHDNISVIVTPHDRLDYAGAPGNGTRNINNSAPAIPLVQGNYIANLSVISVNHTFLNITNVSDIDGDTVTYIFIGEKNNPNPATEIYRGASNFYNWSGIDFGTYYWKFTASDGEANATFSGVYQFNITMDNTPPIITLNRPSNENQSRDLYTMFNWTITENKDANATCNLTIRDVVNKTNTVVANGTNYNISVNMTFEGNTSWHVACWDEAGNKNSSPTYWLNISSQPPYIILLTANNTFDADGYNISLFYNATDVEKITGCNLTFDGKLNQSNSTITRYIGMSFNISAVETGVHTWRINCTDATNLHGYSQLYTLRAFSAPNSYISPETIFDFSSVVVDSNVTGGSITNSSLSTVTSFDTSMLNSTLSNSNLTGSNITSSTITGSNITLSTVSGCQIENSILINSTVTKDPTYFKNCKVINSTVIDTLVISSIVYNSYVDPSTIIDTNILSSNITNSTVRFSTVEYTNFSFFDVFTAGISYNLLTSGRIINLLTNISYYAPMNISNIYANMSPRKVGYLSIDKVVVSNASRIIITYSGDVGYTVWLNVTGLGGPSLIRMADNTTYPDDVKDDGLYKADHTVNTPNTIATIKAFVNDNVGNNWTVTLDVPIGLASNKTDNTAPALTVTDDGYWTGSNNSFHAKWNASDYETEQLHLAFSYNFTLICNSTAILARNYTAATEATMNTAGLIGDNRNCSWNVIVTNGVGLTYNATSDGIIVDLGMPNITNVTSQTHPLNDRWYSGNNPVFNWTANDSLSGVTGFSYILDQTESTAPDNISETSAYSTQFNGIADGTYYLHIRAKDNASNWGSTSARIIKIDSSAPAAPAILNHTINSSASQMRVEWSASSDISGIMDYELNVTTASASNSYIGNYTNYTIAITSGQNYTLRVRARNGAGLNSTWKTSGETADTTPPQFLMLKPQGTIQTRTILLAVRTDEYAACYYQNGTSNAPYNLFFYTNSTYHESKINLDTLQTAYAYNVSCTDMSGNNNRTNITFTYSATAASGILLLLPNTTHTQSLVTIVTNITNAVGEIPKSSFSVYLGGAAMPGSEFTVLDLGKGIYNISFNAPKGRGSYSLVIGTAETNSSSATLVVSDLALTIRFTGQIASQRNTSYASYARTANYTAGMASDSGSIFSYSSASLLTLDANVADGKAYLFVTAPDADIDRKEDYLRLKSFDEVTNPSFGYRADLGKFTVNTLLKYADIMILGNDTVQQGRFSLILINRGFNSSVNKTMVEARIR